jgi:hypothetical protein
MMQAGKPSSKISAKLREGEGGNIINRNTLLRRIILIRRTFKNRTIITNIIYGKNLVLPVKTKEMYLV